MNCQKDTQPQVTIMMDMHWKLQLDASQESQASPHGKLIELAQPLKALPPREIPKANEAAVGNARLNSKDAEAGLLVTVPAQWRAPDVLVGSSARASSAPGARARPAEAIPRTLITQKCMIRVRKYQHSFYM